MQRGFQLDLNLCTGCSACAVACAIENELPWGSSWRWVDTFNDRHLPGVPLHHLSLACNHCADAPCMHHCPALAYHKDEATGAVLLDPDSCIGCKYCSWACPYDAPRYDAAAGVVSKCTFCHHRQIQGAEPACVVQCPTGALRFGELETLEGVPAVAGFPRTTAEPSIRFVELRGEAPRPDPSTLLPTDLAAALICQPPSKTSLRGEWPLLVFSLICAFLAGAMATPQGRGFLGLPGFLLFAGLAAGASSFHLGQKQRAWRAVLNWRRSWVSREILAFTLYVPLATASFLAGNDALGLFTGILGFGLLFAIDRVYRVTRVAELEEHSARTFFTGFQAAGLAGAHPGLLIGASGLKLLLYVRRLARLRGTDRAVPDGSAVARILAGLVLPPLWILGVAPLPVWMIWGLLMLGEAIDRAQFYHELRIPTPRTRIAADLGARVALLGPWKGERSPGS